METKEAFERFLVLQKELHALSHASGLLYLDGATVAPVKSVEGRGETLQFLSGLVYERSTSGEMKELLAYLGAHTDELNACEGRLVRETIRDNAFIASIPQREYVEFEVLVDKAQTVWKKAKAESNYAVMIPYYEKIVDYNRAFAGYYDSSKLPYDVLLDQYERGLDMRDTDRFFGDLRGRIVPLLAEIRKKEPPETGFLQGDFPAYKQKRLTDYIMDVMGIDRERCAVGETEHPFTINFNRDDVRITTNYHPDSFCSSMYSVIHEGGHALYELGMAEELEYTILSSGASMGTHESQSRLYENMLGRSEAFVSLIFPKLTELFPKQLEGVTAKALYRAINKSEPSLIRIEADELTYPLHIMLRYELEKKLIDGSLAVRDLPEAWNALTKEYLGIDVPDDAHGVLQDSHWSGGSIGYFPSYAIGSAYAAQITARMHRELDIGEVIASGSLKPINDWLDEKMHRFGRMYDPAELIEKVCGEPFSPKYYTDYLEKKFSEVYGL